ncbi:23S rRNA (uracil(1939)-C(5))-methyltransferase RlmD [Serratia quinivorans]|nr:23S rRNA (uracil(1939)-C(5))-methyltransferase RlmD [Serratia quinivorans]
MNRRSIDKLWCISLFGILSERLEKLCGETLYYQVDGLRLDCRPCDFIHINSLLNQLMVGQALEWFAIQPNDRVLDLFCGQGLSVLPLARRAAGIEVLPHRERMGNIMHIRIG